MAHTYSNNLRLQQFETFNAAFENLLPVSANYRAAFHSAENQIGRRYTCYESFKRTRYNHLKKKK